MKQLRGAEEMGLGEAEAQRGLAPAQVTQSAEAESGLGPGLHPLPVNFRGDGGGTAGWQEGPADALTRKGLQGICWARGWEIPHALSEPQFLCSVRVCLPLRAVLRLWG